MCDTAASKLESLEGKGYWIDASAICRLLEALPVAMHQLGSQPCLEEDVRRTEV